MDTEADPGRGRKAWLPWLVGLALLAVVVTATLHVSEERALLRMAERVAPRWLLLAVSLQAATYVAQGGIWRQVGHAVGVRVSARTAFEISLVKLFIDQALPTAGLSSSALIAHALEQRHMPLPAVRASVLLNVASYHLAYVVALVVALAVMWAHGDWNPWVIALAASFLAFALGLSVAVLGLAGRGLDWMSRPLQRLPGALTVVTFVADADPRLVRSPRLLAVTVGLQLVIVALDAATLAVLIAALGARVPISGVFASFMLASLVRTMGLVPGGLGTFEATSVLTLRTVGVDVAVALSATLLFRGLSFWLPMLPGYWMARRVISRPAPGAAAGLSREVIAYWALEPAELCLRLESSVSGLQEGEARRRLATYGPNVVRERSEVTRASVLARQLRSPLLLLLVFAAVASLVAGEWLDATIVLAIVGATVGIGYSREISANAAASALGARLRRRASAVRDGQRTTVAVEDLVPGDIVLLAAGSLVPADGVVLEATDLFISEAALTGESFPVPKAPGRVDRSADLVGRTNCVFLGTHVRSGTARALVVETGRGTAYGAIAHRLSSRPPETDFDRGVRHFGYLLTRAMLTMTLLVFVAHMFLSRPPAESLLFAVALAVGLSPELLPAILSVSLARGATALAAKGVLVRRLNAIENLGSMSVLCTDKTGTLTEGVVQLQGAYDAVGQPSSEALDMGAVNAALETGVTSPLDEAITAARLIDRRSVAKCGEVPFDFVRKRVSVVVHDATGARLITKGAFHHVLEICTRAADGAVLDDAARAALEQRYHEWTAQGIRVLAVATRSIERAPAYRREDERDLCFQGFLTFLDRPKAGVREALSELAGLGVAVKIITGDSRLVAVHVARAVGLSTARVLSGHDLDQLHDDALWAAADKTDLFVEVDPNQKERIILALKRRGHVVGFLGDGVNDAPAMHAADTSLSVDQAVDVARETADFVLLERGLDVIRRGVEEGRTTFANTLKYVLITTSANLGNMVSMAAASVFLPFLPLTAGQILLNNFLSDVPALGIADDLVDRELVDRPQRWNIAFIRRYMLEFGVLSSAFDLLTFGVLLWGFHAPPPMFRTGWFVESLLTELAVALVVRTQRPAFRSRPGTMLLGLTVAVAGVALALPYLPVAGVLGFVGLPARLMAAVGVITLGYVGATELLKVQFYRRSIGVRQPA